MIYAYWTARVTTLVISLFLLLWILPAAMMPEKAGEAYLDYLLNMRGSTDPSRFAAIPFVYLFISLPVGVIFLVLTEIFWLCINQLMKK